MCQLSQIILIQKSPGYRPRLIHQHTPLRERVLKIIFIEETLSCTSGFRKGLQRLIISVHLSITVKATDIAMLHLVIHQGSSCLQFTLLNGL